MNLGKNRLYVYLYKDLIGELEASSEGYQFTYLDSEKAMHPVSLSLPFEPKKSDLGNFNGSTLQRLPHYFENLLPEGWLLTQATEIAGSFSNKLEILHALCSDPLGACSFSFEKQNSLPSSSGGKQSGSVITENQYRARPNLGSHYCRRCAKRLLRPSYNGGFHEQCSSAFFGTVEPPEFNFEVSTLSGLAQKQLRDGRSVTGAQVKLSLIFQGTQKTILEDSNSYIIKPQVSIEPGFNDLPRMEHIIMRFADHLGLGVADSALIQTRDGRDAFITKRFDRYSQNGEMRSIHIEDMAQATGVSKGDNDLRYRGSYELMNKVLDNSLCPSKQRKKNKKRLFESLIFNFLVGNTDAHLKNHSIRWYREKGEFELSPFYDLVPNKLYCNDQHDIGLKLSGKNHLDREMLESFQDLLALKKDCMSGFLERFKAERGYFLQLLKAYHIREKRCAEMMEIIAQGFKKLRT